MIKCYALRLQPNIAIALNHCLFMPPGPAYNWFCVAYSVLNILSHAAQYRAAQLAPKAGGSVITTAGRGQRRPEPTDEELSNAVKRYCVHGKTQDITENIPAQGHIESRPSNEVFAPSDIMSTERNENSLHSGIDDSTTETLAKVRESAPHIIISQVF